MSKHLFPTLCPEHELILLCIRRSQATDVVARIYNLCQGKLDWEYLYSISHREALAGLIHRSLASVESSAMPPAFKKFLHVATRNNIARNLRLSSELSGILKTFCDNNIRTIIYKGPIQACAIYGNLAYRHMSDIDLIIHPENISQACHILRQNGYDLIDDINHGNAWEDYFNGNKYEYTFKKRNEGLILEVHWQVLKGNLENGLDDEYLWQSAKPFPAFKDCIQDFPPEVKLLLICVHLEKHNWQAIKFLCDIAWMVDGSSAHFLESVLAEASKCKHVKSVLMGLLLANRLLGAVLPDQILTRILSDVELMHEAAVIHHQLFHEGFSLPSYAQWLDLLDRDFGSALPSSGAKSFLAYMRTLVTPHFEDMKKLPYDIQKKIPCIFKIIRVLRFVKYWTYQHRLNHRRNPERYILPGLRSYEDHESSLK